MSLFKYLFDTEWGQRNDIEELKQKARRQQILTSGRTQRYDDAILGLQLEQKELEIQIGELQLTVRALLQMLNQTKDWNDSTFEEMLEKLDLEDGVLDGMITKPTDDQKEH